MAINLNDDLDEMLSADDFGVTFTHNGVEVTGILTEEYFESEVGRSGVEGFQPVLYIEESVTFDYDETITISGSDYKVINIHPDRTGIQMVMLHAL